MAPGERPCEILLRIPDDVDLPIPLDAICQRCEGTGKDPEEKDEIDIGSDSRNLVGRIYVPAACKDCGGSGWMPTSAGRAVAEFFRRHLRLRVEVR